MTLTKDQIELIVPKLGKPIDITQYLRMPKFNNDGADYRSVMGYDPVEAEDLRAFLDSMETV